MSTEINRIIDMNIYTILESEEHEEEAQDYCNVELVDIDNEEFMMYKNRKNEKKIDVYKIMKEYVNKHGKKY